VIHVGFTGTRHGMSEAQASRVKELVANLARIDSLTCHHGDCIGADSMFHDIARFHDARVTIHPGQSSNHEAHRDKLRAFRHGDITHAPLGHFARNRVIVTEADVMIGTPLEMTHQDRGGTWFTIDYAKKVGRPLAIVLRGGEVDYSCGEGLRWPAAALS
jgi:hypothetical protein